MRFLAGLGFNSGLCALKRKDCFDTGLMRHMLAMTDYTGTLARTASNTFSADKSSMQLVPSLQEPR
jgi:hypothetical protein